MITKPGDFYVGIMDFLGILLPGSILLAYVLLSYPCILCLTDITIPIIVKWIAFFITAYVLGHFLFAVAGFILDPVYDHVYAKARRIRKAYLSDSGFIFFKPFIQRYFYVSKSICNPKKYEKCFVDVLCDTAKEYKKTDLDDEVPKDMYDPRDTLQSSVYSWSESIVRMKSPSAIAEVEKLQAQSKFFRSLSMLILLLIFDLLLKLISSTLVENLICPVSGGDCRMEPYLASGLREWPIFVLLVLMFMLSMWRFQYLRWHASRRVYEYFIGLRKYLG